MRWLTARAVERSCERSFRRSRCSLGGRGRFQLSCVATPLASPRTFALIVISFALICVSVAGAASKEKTKPPTVRWDEQQPGCTFSATEDGKYLYGLWSGDVGVTLAVDAQELAKVRRRHEPIFGVRLTVRYRGQGTLDVSSANISLEFVRHFHVIQTSLDPDDFSAKIQADADELDHQTVREIEKHPDRKDAKEAYLRAFQKDVSELLEFLSKNGLRTAQLDLSNPEASGWVFFNASNKWISDWKKQEEFVLRVPFEEKIFEFPFRLPPKEGELLLRHRD